MTCWGARLVCFFSFLKHQPLPLLEKLSQIFAAFCSAFLLLKRSLWALTSPVFILSCAVLSTLLHHWLNVVSMCVFACDQSRVNTDRDHTIRLKAARWWTDWGTLSALWCFLFDLLISFSFLALPWHSRSISLPGHQELSQFSRWSVRSLGKVFLWISAVNAAVDDRSRPDIKPCIIRVIIITNALQSEEYFYSLSAL